MEETQELSFLTTELLLQNRENVTTLIADAEEMLKSINGELFLRVSQTEEKKLSVGEKTISIVKRLSFKDVSLDVAKKFRAVKKVVDPQVLKPLYEKGVKMEGVTYSEYVLVK